MFIIEDTIVSDDFADHCFICDINKCRGACCVQGDAGAPLEIEELSILNQILPKVLPFMTEQGKKAVELYGTAVKINNDEYVTTLADSLECAFAYFEEGKALCAIEKAWSMKLIDFQKPISCHLYPARLTKFKDFTAVNYHQWHICRDAIEKGEDEGVKLYEFLKEPLIRKFGEKWYEELVYIISKNARK